MSDRRISASWALKRRSPTRRPACSPAWPKVQWPCSIATASTTNGWRAMPAISACRASWASAAARRRTARLVSCSLQDSGSDVVALIHGRRIEYRLGAAGEHWVLNSIAALAVAEALGADVEQAAASLAGVDGIAGARRAALPEVRQRHGRASGRELQRQPDVGSRHARHPGAHRTGQGRPPAAGAGRHARAGRGRRRLPCRARRCGGGQRRGTGLPVRAAHGGAVAQARAGAARRASAGFRWRSPARSRRRCGQEM